MLDDEDVFGGEVFIGTRVPSLCQTPLIDTATDG